MKRTFRISPFIAAALLVLAGIGLHSPSPAQAATMLVTSRANSGAGTLRQAILNANATAEVDRIEMRITGPQFNIALTSPLPEIIYPVTITGETQAGWAAASGTTPATLIVELPGTNAGAGAVGLHFGPQAGGSVVRGLVINRFATGILIEADHVVIAGNHIGVSINGLNDQGNSANNIEIASGTGTLIGGLTDADRNVISGSGGNGVQVAPGVTFAKIQGNYIGPNATGNSALPNDGAGVLIGAAGGETVDILVGGNLFGAGNVISGNVGAGVSLLGNAHRNTIAGNIIGPSPIVGVLIRRSGAGMSNAIGVYVNSTSASKNTIGLPGIPGRNLITDNGSGIEAPDGVLDIQNNHIGVLLGGAGAVGNRQDGINLVDGGSLIGGAAPGLGNVISGNGGDGLELGTGFTTVYGNLIGVIPDNSASAGNSGYGINGMAGILGGTEPGQANRIVGNSLSGVRLTGTTVQMGRNTTNGNASLGIDLGDEGVRANEPGSPLNYPVITSVARTADGYIVSGTLNSTPNTNGIVIEFYASRFCDQSLYGEGDLFLGAITVNTNASGDASFNNIALAGGGTRANLTALAVQPSGTVHSEYSRCAEVPFVSSATLNASIAFDGRGTAPDARWAMPFSLRVAGAGGGAVNFDGTSISNQSGVMTLYFIPGGTYDVRVKQAQTLSCEGSITLTGGATGTLNLGRLRLGDTNGDDVINITDFSLLAASFGLVSGAPGHDALADFNGDNVVNISDFSLLASNFGLAGPSCISG